MAAEDVLQVQVAYASTGEQMVITLSVPLGCTVTEAIALSGIAERCPELAAGLTAVGIHGKVVAADTVLCGGERIEIYRPLAADPKQVRRRRAAANR
jgi:putative ubiquitin-RnfH superfamily antitoxin RatB of RatAB toxin-antitoxin module